MDSNTQTPLTHSSPASLFLAESHHIHMPTPQPTDALLCSRRQAISSISQFATKLDPFISYLAVSYLERFLSSQAMPQQPKTWVLRLIAISCVSLAAKMNETDFSLADFQADGGFMFDAQTIERMEYVILGALKWRMRPITPFSFVSFFVSFFKPTDPSLTQALNARAVEIISKTQSDVKHLEFKPSIIAASALLSASNELFPSKFPCYHKAISSCSYVHKENLLECYNWMEEIGKERDDEWMFDMVSRCNTAVNVLDQQFSCSESENGSSIRRDMKGRRINDYSNNQTDHISQVQHC
ncbi:Cyclin D6;1 [Hibiscus trionum]|uniref:Cyclin D61 n=1 Tax=Hibiscus trionum TaxID=183268 RepID=A0A9W7I3Y2_HIBTR|nr:Cyclin D6;1 [Hibiscus trionum]